MSPAPFLNQPPRALFDEAPHRPYEGALFVPPFRGLAAWLAEIDRQGAIMRPRRRLYERFDRTARHPSGQALHGLDRVWDRAELGLLITEAVNRGRQLAMGRVTPRPKGPRLDPARLPDERLDHLIQHHRDMTLVEALRAERRRRGTGAGHAAR